MIGCYDLLFLRFGVALFWVQYKALVTRLAPYLLASAFIVTVFYHVFTATMATLSCAYCLDHLVSLSLITYLATLPLFRKCSTDYPPKNKFMAYNQ